MNPLAKMVQHPWAALLAWLMMAVFVAANAFAIAGLRSAAEERERLSCMGALDTRQVIADVVEDLASILQDQEAAARFRDDTVSDMRQPPLQCEAVER